jgi:monoamine oxidase
MVSNYNAYTTSNLDEMMTQEIDKTNIVIVGAGAAGLTAARRFLKKRRFFNVKILEASDLFGGRIRKTDSFADFSIDLGASFISHPRSFRDIVQGYIEVETIPAPGSNPDPNKKSADDLWMFANGKTWYDFFAEHMDTNNIIYNCKVDEIEYGNNEVLVSCGERMFRADHVIVTVPLSMLKDGDIQYDPPLPDWVASQHLYEMQEGIVVIMEFKETFYPSVFTLNDGQGDSRFWDISSVHQESNHHVLSGHFIGKPGLKYADMNEPEIIADILARLDVKFGRSVASEKQIKHLVVNWSKDPFIRGTIASLVKEGPQSIGRNKIFFAGDAFPVSGQEAGWVYSAAMSGLEAAERVFHLVEQENQLNRLDH